MCCSNTPPRKASRPRSEGDPRGASQVHHNDPIDDLGLAIRLRMKRHTQAKLHTCKLKQIAPQIAGEDWVAITDNGVGEAVEAHNAVKEGVRHRGSRVGVADGDEVRIFGKPINHR